MTEEKKAKIEIRGTMEPNHKVYAVAHLEKGVVVLVGENGQSLTMTPNVALHLANELFELSKVTDDSKKRREAFTKRLPPWAFDILNRLDTDENYH